MNGERSDAIGEGRHGRGSRATPPTPPCECVVQLPVRTERTCTTTIRLFGVRGGAGTSTVAALAALMARTMVPTELVTSDLDHTAALLGIAPPVEPDTEALPGLRLVDTSTGSAELTIIDGGLLTGNPPVPAGPGESRVGVLRGPCYLALRTLLAAGEHSLHGLVLVEEPGRALTHRDVADVVGTEIVATVPVSPSIARAIDAGLLAARTVNEPQLRPFRRWLCDQLEPFPARQPPAMRSAPPDPS